MHILNEQQEALLKDERRVLNKLLLALAQFGAGPQDLETLGQSIEQLDELFLLVVVGEFNAGKSALINALLGQSLLKEGATPTTTEINVLRYAETPGHSVVDRNQHVLTLPASLLTEISIVDTPGTNAILRAHEALTAEFVPRSDLGCLLPLPTGRSLRANAPSWSASATGVRRWSSSLIRLISCKIRPT